MSVSLFLVILIDIAFFLTAQDPAVVLTAALAIESEKSVCACYEDGAHSYVSVCVHIRLPACLHMFVCVNAYRVYVRICVSVCVCMRP